MKNFITDKNIHRTFEVTLFFKGILAIIQIIGGVGIFFTTQAFLLATVSKLTQVEPGEDLKVLLSHHVFKFINDFSPTTQYFVSFYLLSHGIVKLILVIYLFKKKLWAYPAAIFIFSIFILYQVERYTRTHSPWLLLITAIDVLVIILTLHEYKLVRQHRSLK